MIVDERSYTLVTGKLREYLQLYRDKGYEVQKRHLGEPFGLFSVEIGGLDGWVHLWAYRDVADRALRRHRLAADPEWQAFTRSSGHLIAHRKNRLLDRIDLEGDTDA